MAPSCKSASYAVGLAARMAETCAGLSFNEIARRTESNRETVRRYMTDGRPPAEFVARLSEAFGVSGTWLLTGRGPKCEPGPSAVHTRKPDRAFLGGRSSRSRRIAAAS